MGENLDQAASAATSGQVAVVIPAYGEAASIGPIVAGCLGTTGIGQVIVVDDGSRDATAARARAAGAVVLVNTGNRGKGASLVRGLGQALTADPGWVVTMDGDGQHRPEDLPALLDCARAHPGCIVIGSRRRGGAAPRGRYIANRVADFWVSWASGYPVDDSQSGFRVLPAGLLRRLDGGRGLAAGFGFESELLIAAGWLGVATVSVDIPAIYGAALQRPSHFRPVADIARIARMVAIRLLRRGLHPAGLWRLLRSVGRGPAGG